MAFNIKQQSSGGGDPLPLVTGGLHKAVCYGVVDLGTQFNETYGKEQRKARLLFELLDETAEFTVFEDGKPTDEKEERHRVLSREFTASLNEGSHLYKQLISWRGRAFTKEELEKFDLENLVGASCQLQIIHNPTKADPSVSYAWINAILPPVSGSPKHVKADDLENGYLFFTFDEFDPSQGEAQFEKIPGWLVDKFIKNSQEWKALSGLEPDSNDMPPADDDEAPF